MRHAADEQKIGTEDASGPWLLISYHTQSNSAVRFFLLKSVSVYAFDVFQCSETQNIILPAVVVTCQQTSKSLSYTIS